MCVRERTAATCTRWVRTLTNETAAPTRFLLLLLSLAHPQSRRSKQKEARIKLHAALLLCVCDSSSNNTWYTLDYMFICCAQRTRRFGSTYNSMHQECCCSSVVVVQQYSGSHMVHVCKAAVPAWCMQCNTAIHSGV